MTQYNQSHPETVLVTGGAGYIGSHVVCRLIQQQCRVRVLERADAPLDHLAADADVVIGDIRDPNSIRRAMDGCDSVLHLAANPNLWAPRSRDFDEINHQGTRHVLGIAHESGVRRIVHVSTESILTSSSDEVITESTPLRLEQAIGPYCRSKVRAELAAVEFAQRGLPVVIVSPTVPVGPGDYRQGPLTRMICQFARGSIRGYMDAEVNLIDVRDVADGVIAAMRHGKPGRRYLLAAENWRIRRLFDLLGEITGIIAPRLNVPYWAALLFAGLEQQYCRFTKRTPMATVTGIKLARRSQRFDGTQSASELGLRLRSCAEAIRNEILWLSRRGEIPGPHSAAGISATTTSPPG